MIDRTNHGKRSELLKNFHGLDKKELKIITMFVSWVKARYEKRNKG